MSVVEAIVMMTLRVDVTPVTAVIAEVALPSVKLAGLPFRAVTLLVPMVVVVMTYPTGKPMVIDVVCVLVGETKETLYTAFALPTTKSAVELGVTEPPVIGAAAAETIFTLLIAIKARSAANKE